MSFCMCSAKLERICLHVGGAQLGDWVQLPGHRSCLDARNGQEAEEEEGQGEASASVCHLCAAVSCKNLRNNLIKIEAWKTAI